MTVEQALALVGARRDPVYLPLEREFIFMDGLAKVGKSTVMASFPGMLHIDFGGEAHMIPGRRGHHVYCPVYRREDLVGLRTKSPGLFTGPLVPTCVEDVDQMLNELAAKPDNPITGFIIDGGEQYQRLVKDHLERKWGKSVEDYRGGKGGHGSVNDLAAAMLWRWRQLGYGCAVIAHTCPTKEGEGRDAKTVWRTGLTPGFERSLREDASYIWTVEKSNTLRGGEIIPSVTIATQTTKARAEGTSTGNRVPLPEKFVNVPQTDVYSIIAKAHKAGFDKLMSLHGAGTTPK